ncbi:4-hydroxyphenylacetate 3-hydroxylase N-terminal domain-containing protein [Microbacterium sp. NPDC076911]|uniref:4-hydroxyphenylacetate 3-hydroxylase family protein n=1 Tax=Microbacterium sp. NPDC076911 TaxID=3154958 RepID=UPI003412FD34
MRTGQEYLAALADGREVWVDGERVESVAEHAAFRGVAQTTASIYDQSNSPGSELLDPDTGRPRIYSIPRTVAESNARRAALEEWSAATNGFIGRGADHVSGLLAGFASNPAVFDDENYQLGNRVVEFHEYAASRSLWITNAIVPPQANPLDTSSHVRPVEVVDEGADGIIVDGAQMLASGGAVADELFVTCVRPLAPGEESRALSFVVPINAKGLRLISRRPYATMGDAFDYPLSARYDESDSMVTFDQVKIPWERVFIVRNRAALQTQFFGTAAHQLGNIQAVIRLSAKLRFIAGLASKAAKANGREKSESVKNAVAEVSLIATTIESFVESAYARAYVDDVGVVRPEGQFLYAALGMQTEMYPRAIKILGELVGGGVIQLPSSAADMMNPTERASMRRLMGSEQLGLDDRVKLFKLVWDAVGTEFAGRHVQYERFYSGAPAVVKNYAHRNYPFDRAERLVDDFLSSYGLPGTDHD